MNAISHFIQSPALGKVSGECVLCGIKTENGFPVKFSDNFTAYSELTYGNVLCPHCEAFFRDQNFRRKSWILTPDEIRFVKREEIPDFLLAEQKPIPFVIYVNSTGQRQGWLKGFKTVNFSSNQFFIHTDFAGCVFTTYDEVVQKFQIARELREKKVSKTELKTGEFTMHTYKRAIEGGWEKILQTAKNFVSQPIWEVIIYVC